MSGAGRKVFAGGRDVTDLTSLAVEAMCDLRHSVKTEVAEWAAEHLGQRDLVTADRESIFSEDDWKACADRGLLGLIVSPTFGGRGQDLITLMLSLEGLGLGCRDNGLVFALASQVLSTQYTIERFGSDEQCRTWLPRLCDGSAIGAFAITEPGSGSNAYAMSTTAEPTADGYVLNGHKAYLTLGPRSDVCVVFAATDPAAGSWGISAFLVPMDLPGVQRGPNRGKDRHAHHTVR